MFSWDFFLLSGDGGNAITPKLRARSASQNQTAVSVEPSRLHLRIRYGEFIRQEGPLAPGT